MWLMLENEFVRKVEVRYIASLPHSRGVSDKATITASAYASGTGRGVLRRPSCCGA